jgi:hypothetical protein
MNLWRANPMHTCFLRNLFLVSYILYLVIFIFTRTVGTVSINIRILHVTNSQCIMASILLHIANALFSDLRQRSKIVHQKNSLS